MAEASLTDERIALPPVTARSLALPLAGYGQPGRVDRTPLERDYAGETYYGRPALKPSPFGWMVGAYIWIAGLGGAAQIIATLADLLGPPGAESMVRRGRHIAFATAPVGAALLIADLHTPQRFYNMLRIFRRTSPMSIGTYVLMSFGLFSGLTALGQSLADRGRVRWLARAAQVPAALSGAGMTTYTAALLATTSTPLWAAEPRLLAIRFASSAMASGAAALSLGARADGHDEGCGALDTLAAAATAVEFAAAAASESRYREKGVGGPLQEPPWGPAHKLGVLTLGNALPLALHALGRRGARASIAASLAVLAGGFLMRSVILHAGNRSAQRPADYFRSAQPRPAGAGHRRWSGGR
jgi:protein NrfD